MAMPEMENSLIAVFRLALLQFQGALRRVRHQDGASFLAARR